VKSKKFTVTAIIAVVLIIGIVLLLLFVPGTLNKVTDILNVNKKPGPTPSAFTNLIKPSDTSKVLLDAINSAKCVFPEKMTDSILGRSSVPGIKDGASTQDDYWIVDSINPVVLGYITVDGVNYMIGGLKDTSGNCKKIAFVINGQFNVEDKSGMLKQDMVIADNKYITFDQYKETFPIGTQVETFILTIRPDSTLLVDELCNFKPPVSQYYCALQRISEKFSKTVIVQAKFDKLFAFPSDKEQLYVFSSNAVVSK
jgi:hypothetical protein